MPQLLLLTTVIIPFDVTENTIRFNQPESLLHNYAM